MNRYTDPAFIEASRVVPLVHRTTGLPVDLVLAGPGLEEEFLERAVVRRVDGVDVPVVEVSDLVILKVLAARPKDADDVVALLRIQVAQIARLEPIFVRVSGLCAPSRLH